MGILKPTDRVELIRGEIVKKLPQGPRHQAFIDNLNALLIPRLLDRARVSVQSGVALSDDSEPEPDIKVLRLRDDVPYKERGPFGEDVLLLVEVAVTSLRYDRTTKLRSITTPLGNRWTYLFGTDDRVKAVLDPKGSRTSLLWDSSGNRGWGIFSQPGGNIRINFTGTVAGNNRFNFTSGATPAVGDGNWHNVIFSFSRGALGSTYVDGVAINTQADPTIGTIDTDDLFYSVNVGQDGRGTYTDGGSAGITNALIDDVGIWRRALSGGCSSHSSSHSQSRCRCSHSTPGFPTRTSKRQRPARCFSRACC